MKLSIIIFSVAGLLLRRFGECCTSTATDYYREYIRRYMLEYWCSSISPKFCLCNFTQSEITTGGECDTYQSIHLNFDAYNGYKLSLQL